MAALEYQAQKQIRSRELHRQRYGGHRKSLVTERGKKPTALNQSLCSHAHAFTVKHFPNFFAGKLFKFFQSFHLQSSSNSFSTRRFHLTVQLSVFSPLLSLVPKELVWEDFWYFPIQSIPASHPTRSRHVFKINILILHLTFDHAQLAISMTLNAYILILAFHLIGSRYPV